MGLQDGVSGIQLQEFQKGAVPGMGCEENFVLGIALRSSRKEQVLWRVCCLKGAAHKALCCTRMYRSTAHGQITVEAVRNLLLLYSLPQVRHMVCGQRLDGAVHHSRCSIKRGSALELTA